MLHDRDYMRGSQSAGWLPKSWPDPVTTIIIANVAVYLIQLFVNNGQPFHWGQLSIPALQEGRVWTLFTYMFLHGSLFHILGNCLMIFFTGKALQSLLGARKFLYVYFLSGVAGAILQLAVNWLSQDFVPMVGASGCAFGVFLALAAMLPQEQVTAMIFFLIPVRVKLWNLAVTLFGISVVLGVLQMLNLHILGDNVAHFAHVGGALAGWWYVRTLGYGGKPVTYERLWQERQQREQSRELATVRKPRRSVMQSQEEVLPEPVSAKEFIEREIDPILEKIAAHGISSLTQPERNLLEQARTLLEGKPGDGPGRKGQS